MGEEKTLLKAIFHLLGRQTFDEETLKSLVIPTSGKSKDKLIQAYNLCDGSNTQGDVAKAVGLDPGNFSRIVKRWISSGVLVKMEDQYLLHLYPISE